MLKICYHFWDDQKVVLDGVERLNRLVASFILPDLAAASEQLQSKVLSWFHYCSKLNYWKKMFWPFSAYCLFSSSFRFPIKTLEYEDVKNYSAKKFRYCEGCVVHVVR